MLCFVKKESCLLCIEPEGVAERSFVEAEKSVHVGAGVWTRYCHSSLEHRNAKTLVTVLLLSLLTVILLLH